MTNEKYGSFPSVLALAAIHLIEAGHTAAFVAPEVSVHSAVRKTVHSVTPIHL